MQNKRIISLFFIVSLFYVFCESALGQNVIDSFSRPKYSVLKKDYISMTKEVQDIIKFSGKVFWNAK